MCFVQKQVVGDTWGLYGSGIRLSGVLILAQVIISGSWDPGWVLSNGNLRWVLCPSALSPLCAHSCLEVSRLYRRRPHLYLQSRALLTHWQTCSGAERTVCSQGPRTSGVSSLALYQVLASLSAPRSGHTSWGLLPSLVTWRGQGSHQVLGDSSLVGRGNTDQLMCHKSNGFTSGQGQPCTPQPPAEPESQEKVHRLVTAQGPYCSR